MKTALITGAARGLGKYLSEFLLDKGFFVYGTQRNENNIKHKEKLKFLNLDLTDEGSIERISNYFIQHNKKIDVLIHNSGLAFLDPPDVLSEEERRHIFEVNFFGPISLTEKLLPILKTPNRTDIIFISSIVSVDHWPHLGVYAASKNAIETVAFDWAILLKHWNINVSVIQPNPLQTDPKIYRAKNSVNSPYPELNNRELMWEDIGNVSKVLFEILCNPNPDFLYQTGSHSRKTASKFLKLEAYQNALEEYQKSTQDNFKNISNQKLTSLV